MATHAAQIRRVPARVSSDVPGHRLEEGRFHEPPRLVKDEHAAEHALLRLPDEVVIEGKQ